MSQIFRVEHRSPKLIYKSNLNNLFYLRTPFRNNFLEEETCIIFNFIKNVTRSIITNRVLTTRKRLKTRMCVKKSRKGNLILLLLKIKTGHYTRLIKLQTSSYLAWNVLCAIITE